MADTDRYGIVANVVTDGAFRRGAKVHVVRFDGGTRTAVVCSGLSRGGRRIEKWIAMNHLGDYRAAWFPDLEHLRGAPLGTKGWAQSFAECWNFVHGQARALNHGGEVVRDGQSIEARWKEWDLLHPATVG